MYAIIATGGKQYTVSEGDEIRVEKLGLNAGDTVTFDQVLFVNDGSAKVGDPTVKGATVTASVVSEGKGKKVIVYKYKRKTGYHKKNGHRQLFTKVKIEKINAEAGDTVTFDEVIAVGGDTLTVGTPFVEGTAVHAEVVEQGKNDKVIIYKYKAKKDYRKKNGHRQPYTLVKVTDIVSGGQKAAAAEKQDDVKPSMSMKKEELLAIANEKGIEVSSKATKAEILEAIEA